MNQLTRTPPKNELAAPGSQTAQRMIKPSYRVEDIGEAYVVHIAMPGVSKNGVDVVHEHDNLIITGTRTVLPPPNWKMISRESRGEGYRLRLQLNVEVVPDRITAKTEDGILTLTLPKEEAVKPRSIRIE